MVMSGKTGVSNVIDIRTQVWYNPEMVSAYYMIPGLIGMILQFLTTIFTATSIVRERERGTIEQLIVTPITLGIGGRKDYPQYHA